VPFDVSEQTLRSSAQRLVRRYPGLEITALVGDFERPLPALPAGEPRLLAFLGSTIGNLTPGRRRLFLNDVASALDEGDWFLLGADLVKSPARLLSAYDDASGVTREFNLNVLRVLNRELGGNSDVSAFEHVARWNAEAEWMEMFVRSVREQTVRLEALELEVAFGAGELMRTEISAKFHLRPLADELEAAGLAPERWWTDDAGDFAVLLATPGDRAMRPARFELATSASAGQRSIP
jgi:L-histidine N-alpha-methyltransferase